jgi:K+-transporting ATPase ATPase C chain
MLGHLRANVLLLVLTVLVCAVLYPLMLWALGQTLTPGGAQGSLLAGADGKPVGSSLIAQPFTGPGYFRPRPSAAGSGYNAAASGASNYGASNYLLRERVARQLGPVVRYGKNAVRDGKTPEELVGPDIEEWFRRDRYRDASGKVQTGIVAGWASQHPGVAEGWIKDSGAALKDQWKDGDKERDPAQALLLQLHQDDAILAGEVQAALKDVATATSADVAKALFPAFSKRYPGQWLTVEDTGDKQKPKKLARINRDSEDIQGIFFDMWRQEHPKVDLEEVPADMVTTSASGLDPHITLKNARYQLKYRIPQEQAAKLIAAQAQKSAPDFDQLAKDAQAPALAKARQALEAKVGKRLEERLREIIDEVLTDHARAPLGGLVGVPLINVLEVNLAMDRHLQRLLETGQ